MKLSSEDKTYLKSKSEPIKNLVTNMFGPQKWEKLTHSFGSFCIFPASAKKAALLKVALELMGYYVRVENVYLIANQHVRIVIAWSTSGNPMIHLQANSNSHFWE